MPPNDCTRNTDPLRLARDGTSQPQRRVAALQPDYAPVDQRTPAHRMVFARAYAAFLRYYGEDNKPDGDWVPFFGADQSVRLAAAAIEEVAACQAAIQRDFAFLDDRANEADEAGLKDRLGALFSRAATLAAQLDDLQQGLPAGARLKAVLETLIRSRLAPAFRRLLLCYRDGLQPESPPPDGPYHHEAGPVAPILGGAFTLGEVRARGLSPLWIADDTATKWDEYVGHLDDIVRNPPAGLYGTGATLFARVNHLATHNLFTAIFDQFLKALATTVNEATLALDASFTTTGDHEPHYALFLAFLRLFEAVRAEANTLTANHLDFYYRNVLRMRERPAEPAHAHLLLELAKQVPALQVEAGTRFSAGKDNTGIDAAFAADRDAVVNAATVLALMTVYRHDAEPVGTVAPTEKDRGRLFASPVANSDDGMGADLTTPDLSWHPFHNKRYQDGMLAEIRMPRARVGFALASHYLLMAEGTRQITLDFTLAGPVDSWFATDRKDEFRCLLTAKEGWLEKPANRFQAVGGGLRLVLELSGADPAVTAWSSRIHGLGFDTALPILMVELRHSDASAYAYARLQDVVVSACKLSVAVTGLRTLAVSNDTGPVDPSKPFQPYGTSPVASSALLVGSVEVFQKALTSLTLNAIWQAAPAPYTGVVPKVAIDFLQDGKWMPSGLPAFDVGSKTYALGAAPAVTCVDLPDAAPDAAYGTASRHGFIRLRLDADFGQALYQAALLAYLHSVAAPDGPGTPPVGPPAGPYMVALSLDYTASQAIHLDSSDLAAFAQRIARFLHLGPFGHAEHHPALSPRRQVRLVTQFDFRSADAGVESAGECYIGIGSLRVPQDLALLLQVAPGTADPLAVKPDPHVSWSYLRDNEWVSFPANAVNDQTAQLLRSGIVTLSVPRDATDDNTLLPAGMHWVRCSVMSRVDAVCRLLLVAAQAVEVTFSDAGNDPAFAGRVLPPDSIQKLRQPNAAVRRIAQPFASFGGRAAEGEAEFRVRVSERLRHKDRAIALWDIEHLVLEAFPHIYRVRCLNHTQYEPSEDGEGIYRELAPGHVTVVTIPVQNVRNQRDPLRPYTSLDLLRQIGEWLRRRMSCFVRLHVRSPAFEPVRLACRVRFRDGYDESFFVRRLQEEITRFLSPWAYSDAASPSFGGKVYKSALIDFIEMQPYVDYLTDVRLFHDAGTVPGTVDLDEVEGATAVSVLVSAPASRHQIEVIRPAGPSMPGEHCPCEAS